jgi:predicted RNA-binding protein associated with RNAse of E/G family
MSWPCRLVEDRDDLLALYIPRGSTYMRWDIVGGQRRLAEGHWRRDVLRLMFPEKPYSVWLFWGDDPERTFSAYYINMEEPFRRTTIGFDTNDHTLDVVATPDLQWRWKDVEEFDDRVRTGIYSAAFADEVRAEALAVIRRLERQESPFCDGWDHWSPDPAWTIPGLLPGWDQLDATLWERRHWAYLDARV